MMDPRNKLKQNNLKLLSLIKLSFKLLSERDPFRMLHLFSHTTCSLINAHSMTIGIIEAPNLLSGKFCTIVTNKNQMDSYYSDKCSLVDFILRPIYDGQNAVRYSELSSSHLIDASQCNTFSNRSFLGVPIRSTTKTYGVIYFIGKHHDIEFNEEDEHFASTMAAAFAMLYEHIQMYNNVQQDIQTLQHTMNDLKTVETHLRNSEERLRLAITAGQMNSWALNLKTNEIKEFGYYDPSTRPWGQSTENQLHEFVNRVIPEDRQHVKKLVDQSIKQGNILKVEFRALNPNQQLEYLYAIAQVFYDKQNNPECMVGATVIITKQKKMEALVRRHQMELAHIARINSMGEMASTLAHEINQPLTVINAYISGCIRRIENDFQDIGQIIHAMKKVKQNVVLVGEIAHRMKNFIRRGELHYELSNINGVIEEAVYLIHNEDIHPKPVTILFDFTENLPNVKIDKIHIAQAILNLVRNGIEAMRPEKDTPPIITIRSAQQNSQTVIVSIEDNGSGFDADSCKLLFTPYYTTKPDGMGMGLAFCHTIIEAHGGQLFGHNLPEGGACFQFTLPIFIDKDHEQVN